MPSEKERLRRLNEILEMLKEDGGEVRYAELYGKLALRYGITEQTFNNYLDALEYAGKIERPHLFKSTIGGPPTETVKLAKESK